MTIGRSMGKRGNEAVQTIFMPICISDIRGNNNMKLNKKTIIIIIGTAVGVSMASYSVVKFTGGGSLPNVVRQTRQEALEFITSDKFRELEPEQRREYMRSMFGARREQSEQAAMEFFHTPDDMKNVFLDERIKEMQQRREEMV